MERAVRIIFSRRGSIRRRRTGWLSFSPLRSPVNTETVSIKKGFLWGEKTKGVAEVLEPRGVLVFTVDGGVIFIEPLAEQLIIQFAVPAVARRLLAHHFDLPSHTRVIARQVAAQNASLDLSKVFFRAWYRHMAQVTSEKMSPLFAARWMLCKPSLW